MATTETLTVTQDHTTLDLLLWRRFSIEVPYRVEQTLEANPGLAALGLVLPVGTKVLVEIPDPSEAPAAVKIIRLWG